MSRQRTPQGAPAAGNPGAPMFHRVMEATLANVREALIDLRRRFDGRTDPDALSRLELVLAEVLNNITLHGPEGSGGHGPKDVASADGPGATELPWGAKLRRAAHGAAPAGEGRGETGSIHVMGETGRDGAEVVRAGRLETPETASGVTQATATEQGDPGTNVAGQDGSTHASNASGTADAGLTEREARDATAAQPVLVHLTVTQHTGGLACAVIDDGPPLPDSCLVFPEARPAPELSALRAGGFGWFIIRDLTRSLFYFREESRNVLCFNIPRRGARRARDREPPRATRPPGPPAAGAA
ncbi:ATP-binding protein [Paracoccus panacisoli]|uniref:ATP-binding protein n=1 Tax=Paracoccus panacisoli TaxID=1510163 RepID=A0ABV6T7K2_9RHOB